MLKAFAVPAIIAVLTHAQWSHADVPAKRDQVANAQYTMLTNVSISLNIATGFERTNGSANLDLYMDVELILVDPNGLLTNSNDPSYVSREVFIQSLDFSSGAYETIVQTVQGGTGITFTSYESTVSRAAESESSGLTGIQFVQSYDASTNDVLDISGSASADQWQLVEDGTEVPSSSLSACRVKKTLTTDATAYWKARRKDSVAYGIIVKNANSGQEYVNQVV